MTENIARIEAQPAAWLSEYPGKRVRKDLQDWIRAHHKEPLTSDTNTATVLNDILLSLHNLSEQTRLHGDYNKTIAAGWEALRSIRPLEESDGRELKTSTWWHVATMLSDAHYNRAQRCPSAETYKKAEEFHMVLIGAVAMDMVTDLVLNGWSSSRLAAIYMGQHEVSESTDLTLIEEALARSGIAIKKLEREKPPNSIRFDIYETHCLVMFSHFRASGVSSRLSEALKYSTIVVDSFDLQPNIEHWASPNCRATRLWNHGTILAAQYQHYHPTDAEKARRALHQAIEFGKKAVNLIHNDNCLRSRVLNSVAAWFCDQMESRGSLDGAEDAEKLIREALQLNESNRKDIHLTRSHLLSVQYSIFKRLGHVEMASKKLDAAIAEGEQAALMFNNSDSRMGQAYKNLADMQKNKFLDTQSEDTTLCLQASDNFGKAATAEKASLLVRIPAAYECGLLLIRGGGSPSKAWERFQLAISLLPNGPQHAIPSRDLQAILRHASRLAENAASIALAAQASPYEALRSLESSRCIITGLWTKLQVDLSELWKIDRALATRYDYYRRQLIQELRKPGRHHDAHRPTMAAHSLYLEALEKDIRELEAFKNFQQPLSEDEIKALAREGPVLVINVSEERSDAIIVTHHKIQHLNLPRMKYNELRKRITSLNALSNEARRTMKPRPKKKKKSDASSRIAGASEALLWLWNAGVDEILQSTPLTPTRRIWWITSGLASNVPFHAAGDHTPGSKNNTISRATSSYISSFMALHCVRQRAAAAAASGSPRSIESLHDKKMLLVTVSRNPAGHMNLNTSPEEMALQDIFGSSDDTNGHFLHLQEPAPLDVVEHLPRFPFVHFACHGLTNERDPSQSGLLLVGENNSAHVLTLAELETVPMLEHGEGSELAYLSACSTAEIRQESKLASEAIHLGHLFQVLGFTHVVGTLWGASDVAAGEIAKRFYKSLLQEKDTDRGSNSLGSLHVAAALRTATLEFRDAFRDENALDWVPFIHIGA